MMPRRAEAPLAHPRDVGKLTLRSFVTSFLDFCLFGIGSAIPYTILTMLATTRTATRALRTTPLLRQSMVRGVATQAAGSAGSSRRQDWRRQNGRWALGAAAVALPVSFPVVN